MKSVEEMSEYVYSHFIGPELSESFKGNAGIVLFPAMCCVRLFDSSMMKKFASVYAPELYRSWEWEDFGDLLKQYKNSQLLVYERGIAVEPNTRKITETYLQSNDPVRWKKVNKAALEIYRDWLTRPVDQRGLYIVEEIYHMTKLEMPKNDVLKAFRGRLAELPNWHRDSIERSKQLKAVNTWLELDREFENLNPETYESLRVEAAKPEWLKG